MKKFSLLQETETVSPLSVVNRQAEDPALWFKAQTASEVYLQQALRELHEAVEKQISPDSNQEELWKEVLVRYLQATKEDENGDGPCIIMNAGELIKQFSISRKPQQE